MTEPAFGLLTGAVARTFSRRRLLILMAAAAAAPFLPRGFTRSVLAAGGWKIAVDTSLSCAGCTNVGLACAARNSCEKGCLQEQTWDCGCTKTMIAHYECCKGCNAPCRPNQPCAATAPNTIVSDTCPPIGSASPGCQYYARQDKCHSGKCKYYGIEGPKQCASPPPTTAGLSFEQLTCIRQCLQVSDFQLGSSDMTSGDCPKVDSISKYHDVCFVACGASSSNRFPTTLFKWFGNHDGN